MGVIDLADIAPALACPRCRSALNADGVAFRCSLVSCPLSRPGSFAVADRWPVFVDTEQSIIGRGDQADLSAANPNRHRWSIDRVPAPVRAWWKPRNQVAARNIEQLLALLGGPAPLVLVIGGGTAGNGVEAIYARPEVRVVGFDIYGSPLTQFIADAHHIPLGSGSVDAVIIQAVLEHVLDPARVVSEIHRVLRPEGLVYAETPFLQPVHAGPYDFTRFTSSGHRHLFRAFMEIGAGPVAGPGTQLLTGVDHLVRGLCRSELAGKLSRALFFWLRYLDRLIPMTYAMDSASAYYFLGRRSEHELTSREVVGYYRGAQTPATS